MAVAQTVEVLAILFETTGDQAQAVLYNERLLAMLEKIRGPASDELIDPLNSLARIHKNQGDYPRALQLYERVLTIQEDEQLPHAPELIETLNNLAGICQLSQDYECAKAMLTRALSMQELSLGSRHPDVSETLTYLAGVHQATGDSKTARSLMMQAQDVRKASEKVAAPQPDPAKGSVAISVRINDPAGAQTLRILSSAGGDATIHKTTLQVYFVQIEHGSNPHKIDGAYQFNYSWSELLSILRENRRIQPSNFRRKGQTYLLNADPGRYVAVGARRLSRNLSLIGSESQVLFPLEMIFATEVLVTPGEMVFAGDLEALAKSSGTMDAAQKFHSQLLSRAAESNESAGSASLYAGQQGVELDLRASGDNNERSFWNEARRKIFRDEHYWLDMIPRENAIEAGSEAETDWRLSQLGSQALAFWKQDRDEEALEALASAIDLGESILGKDHPNIAALLLNQAQIYQARSYQLSARSRLERALEIREKSLGPRHPAVAFVLARLGAYYDSRGDRNRARSLLERALSIRKESLGRSHPQVAHSLDDLAALHVTLDEHEQAEPLYEGALAIREQKFGGEDPEVARSMNRLAALYYEMGNFGQAEWLFDRALTIRETAYGNLHLDVAESLENLALLYHSQGVDEQAVPLLNRSLAIEQRLLGSKHPYVGRTLMRLALVRRSLGAPPSELRALLRRASEIQERELKLVLEAGSEEQKLEIGRRFARETSLLLSHLSEFPAEDRDAARLAMTTVLRRKGRVLDASARSLAVLRQRLDPDSQALLEELNESRAELAGLVFGGPLGEDRNMQLEKLELEVERIEVDLSTRSAALRTKLRSTTIEEVQSRIPEDAVLVEIMQYEPFLFEGDDAKESWGAPRYVAFVLGRSGHAIRFDLGPASELDRLAEELHAAASDPATEVHQPARALYDALIGPIRPSIDGASHVLVTPDGALNLVPFGVLRDEEGKFTIESWTITFLTSGRDLLRFGEDSERWREGPWLIANPDFDADRRAADVRYEQEQIGFESHVSRDFAGLTFEALQGTEKEAEAIQRLVPGLSVRTGAEATEAVLKERRGPQLLHVATHGFFLEGQFVSRSNSRGLKLESVAPARPAAAQAGFENPLLRSGLALASANRPGNESDDGLLTALEVSGMDLWGTQLVVLSACETGLGAVRKGEGVFGLRRALVIAGSESQVMSLWKVDDEATQELMEAYYRRLTAGGGRSEALRRVQLGMLASDERRHPFYWAGFIASGNWNPVVRTSDTSSETAVVSRARREAGSFTRSTD
jgi:CHAT domain-containing protein/Tfp pilus assembly protein PilF